MPQNNPVLLLVKPMLITCISCCRFATRRLMNLCIRMLYWVWHGGKTNNFVWPRNWHSFRMTTKLGRNKRDVLTLFLWIHCLLWWNIFPRLRIECNCRQSMQAMCKLFLKSMGALKTVSRDKYNDFGSSSSDESRLLNNLIAPEVQYWLPRVNYVRV